MWQKHDDFRQNQYLGAVRTQLGRAIKEQHGVAEPMPPDLLELLNQLTRKD